MGYLNFLIAIIEILKETNPAENSVNFTFCEDIRKFCLGFYNDGL